MSESAAVRGFRWRRVLPAELVHRLSSPTAVLVVWLCYGAVAALVWMSMTATLPLDFASSAEEIQGHLAGGYQIRNPPAFSWLLWATQLLLGKSIVSHMVVRYGLIAAIGMLYYTAVRQITVDRRLAAAISFSLTLFFWFVWDFQYRVTHTLPMIVAGLSVWILTVAWIERPSALRAAGLGLALGLGLVSKWNFSLAACALAAAVVTDRRARLAFADRRALLIPLAALLPLFPVFFWLMNIGGDVVEVGKGALIEQRAPHLARVAEGLEDFFEGYLAFLLPWTGFVAFEAWLSWRAPASATSVDWRGRLALSTVLWGTLLLIAAILAVGIDNMGMRYMYPVLLLLPIAAAAWLAGRVEVGGFSAGLMTASLIFTIAALLLRIASFQVLDFPKPAANHQLNPYAGLADQLRARGLAGAQFVTESVRDSGNLIAFLPEARSLALDTFRVEPPPPDTLPDRPCIALWGGERYSRVGQEAQPPPVPRELESLIAPNATIDDIAVDWAVPLYGTQRQTIWRTAAIPSESPACLSARGLSR